MVVVSWSAFLLLDLVLGNNNISKALAEKHHESFISMSLWTMENCVANLTVLLYHWAIWSCTERSAVAACRPGCGIWQGHDQRSQWRWQRTALRSLSPLQWSCVEDHRGSEPHRSPAPARGSGFPPERSNTEIGGVLKWFLVSFYKIKHNITWERASCYFTIFLWYCV